MSIFEFIDYKIFMRAKIQSMPKHGHGQMLKIAKLLNIHTTMVTHIFRGDSNLSVEQALKLSTYFGFSELETEFFINLVQLERSSTSESKAYFKNHLEKLKARALNLKERLQIKKVLDEKDQALFYSQWYYAAIHLFIAINPEPSPELIADELKLPIKTVNQVIEFLISTGLCIETNGYLKIGESQTYLDRDSKLIARHHANWRFKSIEKFDRIATDELVFTNPVAISREDFLKIREELIQMIDRFRKIAEPSPSEEICTLNIDWIRIARKLD